MYAKLKEGSVEKFPFTRQDLQALYPDSSVPVVWSSEFMQSEGIVHVVSTGAQYDPNTETAEQDGCTFNLENNRWETAWNVRPLTTEEIASRQQVLQANIVQKTQSRLDEFAQTRNYDGILSLCTYATSTNAKFQAEGQYGVEARDATLAKLYEIMAEVESGVRPLPAGFEDIEPELPVLTWP